MIGLVGIALLIGVAVLLSESRSAIHYGNALRAFFLQAAIALGALFTPIGEAVLAAMSDGVQQVISYAAVGSEFIFGPLAVPSNGFIIAFQVLPVIIFIATVFSVLFHLGVMRLIIQFLGGGIKFLTGASRLEATCASANIFVGMAEAPLTILPYLKKITHAQLFVMMSLGLSSVAGTVLVAYAALGVRTDLLLTAAFMAPAGGLLFGRLLVPETQEPFDIDSSSNEAMERDTDSVIEAATNGALIGLQVMLNVIAVLIAFVAVIALLNGVLTGIGSLFGLPYLTMEWLLGHIFGPISYLIGVPWEETNQAGTYLGQKVVLNEFLAYGLPDLTGPTVMLGSTVGL